MQYIITKKNEYSRKLKEYERQKRMEDSEVAENNAAEEQKKLQKFINTEHNIVGSLLSKSKFIVQGVVIVVDGVNIIKRRSS